MTPSEWIAILIIGMAAAALIAAVAIIIFFATR
jgi:hypothetical protein